MAKKKGKHGKKSGGHRKSAKRSKAAKKAAKTRAEKHAARVRAGKKAARTRARKHGHKGHAMEPKKGKSKRGKSKKGKSKKGKGRRRGHGDPAVLIARNNVKLANLRSTYDRKLTDYKAKLERAEGAEKTRLENKIAKLREAHKMEIARLEKKAAAAIQRAKQAEMTAAERKRGKHKKGRGNGRKSRRRNPIDGMGQNLAAGGGVVAGVLLTVLPYRMIRSHALLSAAPSGAPSQLQGQWYDAPAQGDVPNLSAAQLPVWSKLKWKGAIALGVYIIGDLVLPFSLAHWAGKAGHEKTKSFLQVWGYTALTLGATKVVVDVSAVALKKTALGNRLFAAENVARSLRASSQGGVLPTIAVTPGLGLPGLSSPTAGTAGYGKPAAPATGAGCACGGTCGKCKPQMGQPGSNPTTNPSAPPSTNQQPPAGGSLPAGVTQPQTVNNLPTTSVPGMPGAIATGAGAPPDNLVTGRFNRPAPPPGRFSGKRFG